MVSDSIILAALAVVGTILGALIGLFAEPIRACFARKERQEQLRRTLYGELIIKLKRVVGAYIDYKEACDKNNLTYLKSPNKLEVPGSIAFPNEAAAQADYYRLTGQEFPLLAAAYYRLRMAVNFVNQFGNRPLEIVQAKQALNELKRHIRIASCVINEVFKENVHILEKIDNGILLEDWRDLCRELIELPGYKELKMQDYLLDCVKAIEKPAEEEGSEAPIVKAIENS